MKTLFIILFAVVQSCYGQNIIQAEYAVDTDKGFGRNTLVNLAASPDGSFPFTVNLAAVQPGYHQMYVRTKDSNGQWGITLRQLIEVIAPGNATAITRGEYFFDTDPGFNSASPVVVSQQGEVILQNLSAATNTLTAGDHKLYIRMADNNGKWGITTRRNAEIIRSATTVLSGAEYFFKTDAGFGKATPVSFTSPAADGSFTFNIPLDNIPTGTNTLYIRANDGVSNNWSITQMEKDSIVTSSGMDSLWSHPATWSNNKVPDSNTVVILHHTVYVDIPTAVCKSLAPYRQTAQCIIWPAMKVTITGHR